MSEQDSTTPEYVSTLGETGREAISTRIEDALNWLETFVDESDTAEGLVLVEAAQDALQRLREASLAMTLSRAIFGPDERNTDLFAEHSFSLVSAMVLAQAGFEDEARNELAVADALVSLAGI